MEPIDWSKVLPAFDVNVAYSSLELDDKRGIFDDTIAEIGLPDNFFIDVSWCAEDQNYSIRLYEDYFENVILIRTGSDALHVIRAVRELAKHTRAGNTFIDGSSDSPEIQATMSTLSITL